MGDKIDIRIIYGNPHKSDIVSYLGVNSYPLYTKNYEVREDTYKFTQAYGWQSVSQDMIKETSL